MARTLVTTTALSRLAQMFPRTRRRRIPRPATSRYCTCHRTFYGLRPRACLRCNWHLAHEHDGPFCRRAEHPPGMVRLPSMRTTRTPLLSSSAHLHASRERRRANHQPTGTQPTAGQQATEATACSSARIVMAIYTRRRDLGPWCSLVANGRPMRHAM